MALWRRLLALGVALTSACALDTEGLGAGGDDAGSGGVSAAGGSSAGTAGSVPDGGGGTAGGGSSGTGGSAIFDGGTEDCLDGADNDGNSLVDCADPACTPGYQCVPQAPSPYTGYLRTRGDVYNAAAGPACPDGSAPTRYSTGPAGPAECSPCTCGTLAGGQCGAAPLLCYPGSSSCGGTASDWTGIASDGNCHGGNAAINVLSCKLGPTPLIATGQCPPGTTDFANKDPFTAVTDVCRTTEEAGGGCSAGEVCIPRGTGDYAGYVCVEQVGEHTCPAGWGTQIWAYTGANDSRQCTACACSTAAASCVGAEYRFWDDPFCLIGDEGVSSETCKDLTGLMDYDAWSFERSKQPVVVGSCTASGGSPTGGVYPTGALTLCCRGS
jgi:hypothetical protein